MDQSLRRSIDEHESEVSNIGYQTQEQPLPIYQGINVPLEFRKWAQEKSFHNAVQLSKIRDHLGQTKYGQPLMSEDGRDTIQDALEEVGDLLHYLYKARINGLDVSLIRKYLPVIEALCDDNFIRSLNDN